MRISILVVAVVALIYPTMVSVLFWVVQNPDGLQPARLLEAALGSQDGAAIAVVLLLILLWSTAFVFWMAVRGMTRAVSAGLRAWQARQEPRPPVNRNMHVRTRLLAEPDHPS